MGEPKHPLSLILLGILATISSVDGKVCYLGQEPDFSSTLKWVLPYRDPCKCQDVRLGSINTDALDRPFEPAYFNLSTVVFEDLKAVVQLLDCKPGCSTFEASGYGYKFMFAALPRSSDETISVEFAVRANDQVHIALSSHNDDSSQMYEVVIGGWFDTKSVIRRRRQGQNVVAKADPSGWLDGDTYKPFWIRATPGVGGDGRATLTIRVGRGSDTEPFMGYLDTSPLSVSYLGFSMWGDSVGEYRFCGLELAADN
ncbi:uncharacterized protein LOC110976746 [Acanthaster planci]|uniref:Uncharacterized protein LOC110976746 n=1 Tax=Acanthaster planci TaxID=133434 RepID=A0A8B7Y240_ACAPL|nr:uncharacterized protein LOC110976746 [Acanthaster planci]